LNIFISPKNILLQDNPYTRAKVRFWFNYMQQQVRLESIEI